MATQFSISLATGVRLPYVRRGIGLSIPVVLLHGIADTWRSFEPVLERLHGLETVVPTQRGHSGASCPESGYRLENYVEDLGELLNTLQLDRPIIVGHSMGSSVALKFAAQNPDRVRGLVLASAPMVKPAAPNMRTFVEDVVSKLTDPIDPKFISGFTEQMIAGPVPVDFLQARIAENMAVPARVWREAFGGRLEEDFTGVLSTISTPVLLVRGGCDERVTENDVTLLLNELPNARVCTYEDAGHCVHWEQPDRFAEQVKEFVEQIEAIS